MEPSLIFAWTNTLRYCFDIEQAHKKILPFVMQVQPALKGLKNIQLLDNWHLIQNQPNLRDIFKESPLISYTKCHVEKENRLKMCLSRQNCEGYRNTIVTLVCQTHFTHIIHKIDVFTSLH